MRNTASRSVIRGFLIVSAIVVFSVIGYAAVDSKALAKRSAKLEKTTKSCRGKAAKCQKMVVTAVENALSSEDVARESFLASLKGGKQSAINNARKNLDAAVEESEEAADMAERIIKYSSRVLSLANEADKRIATIKTMTDSRKLKSAQKRVETIVEETLKSTEKLLGLMDKLKRKWLIPSHKTTSTTTTTTTTTTTQPPNPTPVGHR